MITDNELLGKFLFKNDASAFEELVHRHSALVMGVCRNMLFHTHDAEDAFQATFLILAKKSGKLTDHGSIAGWLYQVAVRNCLQVRRRKGRNRETEMIDEPAVGNKEPWRTISTAQEYDLIYQEINRLPKRYRDVIVLCHLQNHSRSEAAEFLDQTEASVKAALARGRNLLRRRLIRSGLLTSSLLVALRQSTSVASEHISTELLTATFAHCSGSSSTVAVGTQFQFVQTLANTGVYSMQATTVIKSFLLASVIVVAAMIPLVVIAQSTSVDDRLAETIEFAESVTDPSDSDESDGEFPSSDFQLAGAQGAKSEIRSLELKFDPSRLPDLHGYIPVAVQMEVDAARTSRDASATLQPKQAPDFSIENSAEYWRLILKSRQAKIDYIKGRVSHEGSGSELARVELYEAMAAKVEAELNIKRIEFEKANPELTTKTELAPNEQADFQKLQSLIYKERADAEKLREKSPNQALAKLTAVREQIASANLTPATRRPLLTLIERDVTKIQAYIEENPASKENGLEFVYRPANRNPNDFVSEAPVESMQLPAIPLSTTAVQPGEELLIEVMADSSLNRRVTVQGDFTITHPYARDVNVKGKTPNQIAEILTKTFSEVVKDPETFVARAKASSPIGK